MFSTNFSNFILINNENFRHPEMLKIDCGKYGMKKVLDNPLNYVKMKNNNYLQRKLDITSKYSKFNFLIKSTQRYLELECI